MNIYKARELQKILFKSSTCDFKRMRTVLSVETNKLAYIVLHHISSDKHMQIDEYKIGRFVPALQSGVLIFIDYISKEEKIANLYSAPSGTYIQEVIEID